MQIITHSSCTDTIGKPSDMPNDCEPLPVAYAHTQYGTFAVSYWKPDDEELAVLQAGGTVVLMVRAQGRQHPVVGLTAAAAE